MAMHEPHCLLLFSGRSESDRHTASQTVNTFIRIAAITGRLAGHSVRLAQQVDWEEVGAMALAALKIAIVLTLLAGRATRWVWDSLPGWSEALGRWYSSLLVGEAQPTREEPAQAAVPAPVVSATPAPAPVVPGTLAPAALARPVSPAYIAAAARVRRHRATCWATLQQVGA